MKRFVMLALAVAALGAVLRMMRRRRAGGEFEDQDWGADFRGRADALTVKAGDVKATVSERVAAVTERAGEVRDAVTGKLKDVAQAANQAPRESADPN